MNIPPGNLAAIFGIMIVGAAVPGVSVLTVSSRTAALGLAHGIFVSLGIVAGDAVFISLAIFGLSLLAQSLGDLFVVVRYLGGAYLVGLGVMMWRTQASGATPDRVTDNSRLSSFLAGVMITLGDQKAILFYFGFFPAFVDVTRLSWLDAGVVILMAAIAIFIAKMGYALLVNRVTALTGPKFHRVVSRLAGVVMIATGMYLLLWK